MGELPPEGSPERDEIEAIRKMLNERGYEMVLRTEGGQWVADLRRHGRSSPGPVPYEVADTALEAARLIWGLYNITPSIRSFKPHPDDPPLPEEA